jgi:hypothetical protein
MALKYHAEPAAITARATAAVGTTADQTGPRIPRAVSENIAGITP